MKKIVIFASGNGSNAEKIILHFKDHPLARVVALFCNRPEAFVLQRAAKLNVQSVLFTKEEFYENNTVIDLLKDINPDLIVLAGFLWLIPHSLIDEYQGRIVNLHPALLPKYGGKGMYGDRVHKAVIEAKEKESGISIHHVNGRFDEGEIIFQAHCAIDEKDTHETLAEKIHALEHLHFPRIIESLIR